MNNSICNATCALYGSIDNLRLGISAFGKTSVPPSRPKAELLAHFRNARLVFHLVLGGRPKMNNEHALLPSPDIMSSGAALMRAVMLLGMVSDKISYDKGLTDKVVADLQSRVLPTARRQYAHAMQDFCLLLNEPLCNSEDWFYRLGTI
jgi:hypothetical protein